MNEETTVLAPVQKRTIRAPRGSGLSCKGWLQEAALRMLMNNLDPEVAEAPAELVVYGGTGKAARSWEDFHRIRGGHPPRRARVLRRGARLGLLTTGVPPAVAGPPGGLGVTGGRGRAARIRWKSSQ